MNEFKATVIVNSRTNELLKEWQSYRFDDNSLQKYVKANQISAKDMEIIQANIPNRDSFKLNSPDVIFENTLTIDLGNKVCLIEKSEVLIQTTLQLFIFLMKSCF